MQNIGLLNQKMMKEADEIHYCIDDLSNLEDESLFKMVANREEDIEKKARINLNSTLSQDLEIDPLKVVSMDYKMQTTKIHALESELQLMKKKLQLYVNILAAGKFNAGVIIDSNFTLLENFLEEYNFLTRNSESLYNRMLQYEHELTLDKRMIKKSSFLATLKTIKKDFSSIKNGLDIVTKFVLVAGKFKEFSKISLIARQDLENENLIRDFLNSKSFKSSNTKIIQNNERLSWKYIKRTDDAKNLTKIFKPSKLKIAEIKGFENLEKFIKNNFKQTLKNTLLSYDLNKVALNIDRLFLGIQATWNTTAVETFSIMARNYMIKKSINTECGIKLIDSFKKEFKFLSEDISDERNEEKNNSKAIQYLMSVLMSTLDEIVKSLFILERGVHFD